MMLSYSNRAERRKAAMGGGGTGAAGITRRVASLNWARIADDLDTHGYATTGTLLGPRACADLAASYDTDALFRSRIEMARHGFGRGEYKYFANPLPSPVDALRASFYPPLVSIANRWAALLGTETFPENHASFLDQCHKAGQTRPTPLLLRYGPGDYNCLHQDVYGTLHFPLQVAILLSSPGADFTGGEFALTEQRPRMQSRVMVVPLAQGEGVVFPVNQRPVHGTRGVYRVAMRHGVSRLLTGRRHTLGIIFHEAR
jgi:hypothetical protein